MSVILFMTVLRASLLNSEIEIQIIRDKTEGLNMDLALLYILYVVFLYTSQHFNFGISELKARTLYTLPSWYTP